MVFPIDCCCFSKTASVGIARVVKLFAVVVGVAVVAVAAVVVVLGQIDFGYFGNPSTNSN